MHSWSFIRSFILFVITSTIVLYFSLNKYTEKTKTKSWQKSIEKKTKLFVTVMCVRIDNTQQCKQKEIYFADKQE